MITTPENTGKYEILKNIKNMPKTLLLPTYFANFQLLNIISAQFMDCNVCIMIHYCITVHQLVRNYVF